MRERACRSWDIRGTLLDIAKPAGGATVFLVVFDDSRKTLTSGFAMTFHDTEIVTRFFSNDGRTVNNDTLPLVIMRATPAAGEGDVAAWYEETFRRHDWSGTWRWGVYPFHHFHSNTHEVLGVCRGEAELTLGGEEGERFHVVPGDVLVIPAGVGHQCARSSARFQVVGAYPGGMTPDLLRSGEADVDEAARRVKQVPVPGTDPVFGSEGPLLDLWRVQDAKES